LASLTVTAAETTPRRSLWRHRDFMFLWAGQTVSEVGSAVTGLALPLLALLTLHATTFEVGALAACTNAPFIVVELPAGAGRSLAQTMGAHLGRRRACRSARFDPARQELGVLTLGQLYVVALLTGVLTVFFDVATRAICPCSSSPTS
jgi:hypothetical protein